MLFAEIAVAEITSSSSQHSRAQLLAKYSRADIMSVMHTSAAELLFLQLQICRIEVAPHDSRERQRIRELQGCSVDVDEGMQPLGSNATAVAPHKFHPPPYACQ